MNSTLETKQKIRNAILELIPDLPKDELLDESDIFELGLDSINALTLIFNLQDAFAIKFETSEIAVENFRSIIDIAELLETKI